MTEQLERSLVLVKPDGYRRGLTGEVLRRIEAKGYTLAALSVLTASREQLAAHYAEHEGKPFYEPLMEFMASGPVVAAVIEGHGCIPGFRALAGATNPTEAAPGSSRSRCLREASAVAPCPLEASARVTRGRRPAKRPTTSSRVSGWARTAFIVASRNSSSSSGTEGASGSASG